MRIQAFCGEAAGRIFSRMAVDGWGFDIEILALSRAMRYRSGSRPRYYLAFRAYKSSFSQIESI